ncbi:MAG: amidohydrolase family protein [Gammaproteobacteria bacterium]
MKLFDSHFHIIDRRFPLVENHGFVPAKYSVADYQQQTDALHLVGGAVVSGSFQAFDQGYLLAALQQLGPGFVGVTQLPASCSDAEILDLDRAGVRAVRFNLHRGGSADIRHLASLAQRVYELAHWHVELYVDSAELDGLYPTLRQLPRVSIDHLGLSAAGFATLLKLVEHGVRVKASGFGRLELDVAAALRQISAINPEALLFGTDLPGTRAPRAFAMADLHLIESLFDETLCHKIRYANAAAWYRLADS